MGSEERTGMDGQLAPPLRIELYSRTILHEQARQRRDKVVGRLEELAGTDRVEEVETITWRKRVPVEEDCFECYHYDLFDTWATEAGVSLEPFFSTRRCWEPETEGRGKHMIMPVLGLAVYSGEHLRTVYPPFDRRGGTVGDGRVEGARIRLHPDGGSEKDERYRRRRQIRLTGQTARYRATGQPRERRTGDLRVAFG